MNAGECCMIERGAPSFFDRTEEVLSARNMVRTGMTRQTIKGEQEQADKGKQKRWRSG